MFKKIALILFILIQYSFQSRAGVRVDVDSYLSLMFPTAPDLMDTLGQKVYSISDETGYYSCILMKVAPEKLRNLDRQKFYKSMYETIQDPSHGCHLIKESVVNFTDIIGVEYHTSCNEVPDFPEIRYKRFFLYQNILYVIDFWTFKNQAANAENFKSAFFNSLQIKKDEEAVVPSAFGNSKTSNETPFNLNNFIGLIGIFIALALILVFLRKKPKK
ncbi:MAG: hypothetical protein ABI844_13800 [Saprospiraceae bacterium]